MDLKFLRAKFPARFENHSNKFNETFSSRLFMCCYMLCVNIFIRREFRLVNKFKKNLNVWKYTNLDLGVLIYVDYTKLVMSCHHKSPDPYVDYDGREQQIEIEHFVEYYFLAMYQTIRHEILNFGFFFWLFRLLLFYLFFLSSTY